MEYNYIIALISVLFSALFSGAEIAFVTSNKLKIELDKKNRKITNRILSGFMNKPSDFVSTLLIGNTIALVFFGMSMARILAPVIIKILPEYLLSDFLIMIFQSVISTLIILILAEFTPKVLFRLNPNRILQFFAVPLFAIFYLLFPLQFLFVKTSEFILKFVFKLKLSGEKYLFSHADLNNYIKEYSSEHNESENVLPEIQMFQNAIEFGQTKLRECMVPRNEIVAVEENDDTSELLKKFVNSGHSKILVYSKHIDNIVGYTHSFDIFSTPENIKSIIKPIIYAPETMLAKDVMPLLIQQHKSVAVVVDEFGGTSGMITLEDLIEEIIGEIEDEFDVDEPVERKINDNEFVLSGRLEIDYLNEKYQLDIPENDEYETIAGFIIHQIGRIPAEKEILNIPPLIISVVKASNKRIEQVFIQKSIHNNL
ncbi:MAG: hemolysin family protein [Bacteroidales bacterium]|jgi:CBS domain containing-hemolysin-like protein|nr:hemolysin family protein [Bacteroidales bacterium]MDD4215498.1 hemolysin family protein [Bacteroidales bacterium]